MKLTHRNTSRPGDPPRQRCWTQDSSPRITDNRDEVTCPDCETSITRRLWLRALNLARAASLAWQAEDDLENNERR